MRRGISAPVLSAVLIVSLTGCFGSPGEAQTTTPADGVTPVPSLSASEAETSGAADTNAPSTNVPSTVTKPSPATREPPSSSPAAAGEVITAGLTLYYVAQGDAGVSGEEIGCGDSLVADFTGEVEFTDQLAVSIERLLADKEQFLDQSGLYNALYQSDLAFESGRVEGETVAVDLSGDVVLGGTCDAPRVKAQLEQTAMTAAGAGSANVFVNRVPLDELLSGK